MTFVKESNGIAGESEMSTSAGSRKFNLLSGDSLLFVALPLLLLCISVVAAGIAGCNHNKNDVLPDARPGETGRTAQEGTRESGVGPGETVPEDAAAQSSRKTAQVVQDRFLAAFQAQRYEDALAIVEEKLAKDPSDGVQITYRGACQAALEKYEEAVESFRLGEAKAPKGFMDKTSLYLRALALFNTKMFCRSQTILDTLAKMFPHSHSAEQGQKLALQIEKRLAQGIKESNLNWYLHQGLQAYAAARPALAGEYLGEYFLLAGRMKSEKYLENPDANFTFGGASIELGDLEAALRHLEKVPVEHSEYRAGIMLAIALKAKGDGKRAREILSVVVEKAPKEAVRKRAQTYLSKWLAESGE